MEEYTMDHPKTLGAALCRIYAEVGVEAMKNPSKLPAVFLDIAPNLKAEQNLIQLLANSGCMKTLSAADMLPPTEVKNLVAVCVDSLCNYYSMDRQKAEVLCNTYVKALKGVTYVPNAGKPTGYNGNGGKSSGSVSDEGLGSANESSKMKSSGTSYHFRKSGIIQDANGTKVNTGSAGSEKSKESNPCHKEMTTKSGKTGSFFSKFIKLYVLLLVFLVTKAVSLTIDLATPTTNACLVTAAVAVVMIFCAHSKRK